MKSGDVMENGQILVACTTLEEILSRMSPRQEPSPPTRERGGSIPAFVLAVVATALSAANAATLAVPGSYPTVEDAVNASSDGDTIVVSAGAATEDCDGLYVESFRVTGKSLTLRADPDFRICVVGATDAPIATFEDSPGSRIEGFAAWVARRGMAVKAVRSNLTITGIQRLEARDKEALRLDDGSIAELRNVSIRNSYIGLSVGDDSSVRASDCAFDGNGMAVYAFGYRGSSTILDSRFLANASSLKVIHDHRASFSGNRIEASRGWPADVRGTAEVTLHNNLWVGRDGETPPGTGIYVTGRAAVNVTHNTFVNVASDKIIDLAARGSATITNNIFVGESIYAPDAVQSSSTGTVVVDRNSRDSATAAGSASSAYWILHDPSFRVGYDGEDYFLHPDKDFDLIDAGSDAVAVFFPDGGSSTDPEGVEDTGRVDLGYHRRL